jgi:paraquat-inducible protein B
MTPQNNELPNAVVKSVSRISSIWLIPLVALAIGSWMVIDQWLKQGPLITLEFSTAQGINQKDSLIKLRNITVGKVVEIKLNDELDGVIVTARINKEASTLLTKGSQFWVVKPRISLSSVSGLSTLLSGSYIEFSPGESVISQDKFIGLENPPSTPLGTPGLHITLNSSSDNAFDIGAPILFRGSQVGRIESAELNVEEGKMYYSVFIEEPYDKLITTNTHFWEVTGINFELSGQGISLNTGTIETLLGGGIAFDVPTYLTKGEQLTKHAYFSIFPNKQKVNERSFNVAQNYMLLFNQSIRGLTPGSPVEYKGLHIGEVVRTDIDYPEINNVLDKNTLLPVMIKIYPGRLSLQDNDIGLHKMQINMKQWIMSGLHGAISQNNLLLGSKFIELKYNNTVLETPDFFGDLILIPTADDELEQLMTRVTNITKSIEEIPFGDIMESTSVALSVITESMDQFDATAERVEQLLNDPKSQSLIAQINATLKGVESLTQSYSDGSKTNQQLNDVLQSLDKTINNLSPLIMKLNMQPNRLIFNSDNTEIQPSSGN